MSAQTSRYYRAELGQLDARSQRHKHMLAKDDNGHVVLYAQREDERLAKSHMVALRTMLNHNWKTTVKPPQGFLSLLSGEEYHAALARLPSAEPVALGSVVPCALPTPCRVEHQILSLSPDFDERAQKMMTAGATPLLFVASPNGHMSSEQFDDPLLAVSFTWWRRTPAIQSCLLRARRCSGSARKNISVAQANLDRFLLTDKIKPVTTEPICRHGGPSQRAPDCASERSTGLRRCSKPYKHNAPTIRSENRRKRTAHRGPALKMRQLLIAQVKSRPESLGLCK